MAEPPSKRRHSSDTEEDKTAEESSELPASFTHPISPPRKRVAHERKFIPSPIQLTTIWDYADELNVDAVSLHDLLGDPLIAECWEFNYLHDVDFLMNHFDEDTRSLVKVHIVHGFWKKDDLKRLSLEQQSAQYKNVTLHAAYMPEMFGTHHSKMLILFRHDDTAQVIIHTANMISKDWTNMANGIWQTPQLPLLTEAQKPSEADMSIGGGLRFKLDLLNYLKAYNTKRGICKSMVDRLEKYDFSAVRGALIASVPGRHDIHEDDPSKSLWGFAGIKHALRSVPVQPGGSDIVVQISSIATLGQTDTWLKRTLFDSLSPPSKTNSPKPKFKVIFPTPDEIRRSLDGYASGGSIHMKTQSPIQTKQLQYMKPILYHWANDCEDGILEQGNKFEAGRKRAAPHIKTYIRYNEGKTIDWALLTSANISKQAWGEPTKVPGEIRIASWEIGVLMWPELFADKAKMMPIFKSNMPTKESLDDQEDIVGLRMPYSLPLQKYGDDEVPWVATAKYTEPDWKGGVWE
ncbi:phospholipase D/nuclease [Hypoxylon trugodes]|uniref:phospholipase D/nuclease n=1 Tax=Hypoxylon trugodes TaxID=326681 RepID=UPI0021A1DB9F|nr:phospholipase D/nuclease [Hypoxylon trugodes]KAI1386694.1 phospholipase D/nuclease [Hypoxylon trugodes]